MNKEAGRKRVVHVTSFFLPYHGGIEYYVYYLSKELVVKGYDVSVFTSVLDGSPSDEFMAGIEVKRLKPTFSIFGYPLAISLFKELLRSRANIIHCHVNSPMVTEIATLASLFKRIPLIITFHQGDLLADIIPTDRKMFARFLTLVYRRLLLGIDLAICKKIVVVTPSIINNSAPIRAMSKKTTFIPDGVDMKTFNPPVKPHLADTQRIFFVGRFVPFKGIDLLVRAFSLIRQRGMKAELHLVGDGPLLSPTKKLAEKLEVQDYLQFYGSVESHQELADLYRKADLVVLPSRSAAEGFGMVLIEAMACGVPVMGSEIGGIPYVLGYGKYGVLVKPNDYVNLASAIELVLNDEEFIVKAKKLSLERARKFSWPRIAERIEAIYTSVQAP